MTKKLTEEQKQDHALLQRLKQEKSTKHIPRGYAYGYILIATAPAMECDVYNKVLSYPGVKELERIFGEYDLIGKLVAGSFNTIGETQEKIKRIPEVTDTKLLTGIIF